MKKVILMITGLTCMVTACTPDIAGPQQKETHYPVRFNMQFRKEILPLSYSRSIPPLDIPEPEIRKDENNTVLYKYIEYMVYTTDETPVRVKHRRYFLADEDFGIIYDTLPPGRYNTIFLAHSIPTTTITGNIAIFDKVGDTFFNKLLLTVNENSDENHEVILQRKVGKIEFKASDPLPQQLKTFTITTTNYFNQLDLLHGKPLVTPITYDSTYTFETPHTNQPENVFGFYTLVSAPSAPMEITLTAKSQTKEVLKRHSLHGVIPLLNRVIRYTGKLFTTSNENTFIIEVEEDGRWQEKDEREIEE